MFETAHKRTYKARAQRNVSMDGRQITTFSKLLKV